MAKVHEKISELIKHNASLQLEILELKTQTKNLYEQAPIGYLVLDEAGKIASVNKKARRMLSDFEENLLGKTFLEMLVPEGHETFIEYYQRLRSGQILNHCDVEISRGRKFSARINGRVWSATAGEKLWQLSLLDVTKQKKATEELRKTASQNRQLISMVPMGIAVPDTCGRFVTVNRAFSSIFHGTLEQLHCGQHGHSRPNQCGGLTSHDWFWSADFRFAQQYDHHG